MNGEKRKNQRQSLKYLARIDMGDGSPPRPCVLTDVSVSGARVMVEKPHEISDQFSLLIAPEHGTMRLCKVAWREDKQIGLQFLKLEMPKNTRPRPPAKTSVHISSNGRQRFVP